MGTSTIDRRTDATADQAPRWLRWRRIAAGPQDRLLEELESELALLREENARLKLDRQRTNDRTLSERVRELLPLHAEEGGDEPWEVLTECLLLRDGLIQACREVERGMHETRLRLEELMPAAQEPPVPRDELESVA